MSLVIGIASDAFVLFCSDGKMTNVNGNITNDFKKVFKLAPTIVIGMTGTMEGNFTFLNPFITPELTISSDYRVTDTYDKCIAFFNDRFKCIIDNGNVQRFFTAIGGWIGTSFCINTYAYDKNRNIHDHNTYSPLISTEIKLVYLESPNCNDIQNHKQNFEKFYALNKTTTILNFKNIFKSTVEVGIKFDDSINNNLFFESIRRSDIYNIK